MTNNNVISGRLAELEAIIHRARQTFIEVAGAPLREIRDRHLYRQQGFNTFDDYCRTVWGWSKTHVNRLIEAAKVGQILTPIGVTLRNEAQARELARLKPERLVEVARTIDFSKATAKDIHAAVEEFRVADRTPEPEEISGGITLTQWNAMSAAEQEAALAVRCDCCGRRFNAQDSENIGWARWSCNPVTGCKHLCPYCWARDVAERQPDYPNGFEPTFWPARLEIPYHQPVPKEAATDISYRNVFFCGMADFFGGWMPTRWIEAGLKVVSDNPQWNFLFLTKFPIRMAEFEYPPNAWLGTSVDEQARVANAERAMAKVKAAVRWVSVEPMLQRIQMDWSIFHWVVMGGASASSQTPAWTPPFLWTCGITDEAKKAGCAVYHKTNLFSVPFPDRLREFPGHIAPEPVLPPEFGLAPRVELVQLKGKP